MKKKFFYLMLAFQAAVISASATHGAGGEISYCWLHDSIYQVTYVFYRNCGDAISPNPTQPPNAISINIHSISCSFDSTYTIYKLPNPNGLDITQICSMTPTPLTTCDTSISTFEGFAQWFYSGTVTIPFQCTDWVMSCFITSRATNISTVVNVAGESLYTEATLNNVVVAGNCTPVYNNPPVFYACVGQINIWDYSTVDADSDSLVYSLVPAQGITLAVPHNLNYQPAFSAVNPITTVSGFNLNSQTGIITFSPTGNGEVGVVAIKIDEYRNGNLIATSIRDHMVVVTFYTGIDELDSHNILSLCPNPATNEIRMQNAGLRIESLEIFDVPGEKVFSQQNINANETTVDVSHLQAGIYFVRVKANGKLIGNQKLAIVK